MKTVEDRLFAQPSVTFPERGATLILGGERSGKSSFAEMVAAQLAQITKAPVLYLATLYVGNDPENKARVARHKRQRASLGFQDLEIIFDFADNVEFIPEHKIVLLDCLTNLLTNRLYRPQGDEWIISEDPDQEIIDEMVRALGRLFQKSQHVLVVAQDIGRDIAPPVVESRRFIRLHGKILQGLTREYKANLIELSGGTPQILRCQGILTSAADFGQ